MLKISISILSVCFPFYAFANVECQSESGFKLSMRTISEANHRITGWLRVETPENQFMIDKDCVTGYWNMGSRFWIEVVPTVNCQSRAEGPEFQLKAKENSGSYKGKVFIDKKTHDVSCKID